MFNSEIISFPFGIDKYFPDLTILRIKHCKLRKVTAENLRGFTYLTYLELSNNNLIILEANLFKYNSKLKEIHLQFNFISFIDPNAFNGLKSLQKVDLSDNNNCYPRLEVIIGNAEIAMKKIQDSYKCPALGATIMELTDNANSNCKHNQILNLKLMLVTLLFILVTISLHVALRMILYKDRNQIKANKKHRSESKTSIYPSMTIKSQTQSNHYSNFDQSLKLSNGNVYSENISYEEIIQPEAGASGDFYAEVNALKEINDDKMSRIGRATYAVI